MRVAAHRVFFPLAAGYAALALPASVAALAGGLSGIPGLASPAGHAHEMLFGFALAVIAGNQLGPTPAPRLAALAACWVAARLAFAAAPASAVSALLNAAFPVFFALLIAPRLAGRTLKLRNRALPAALVAFCAIAAVLEASRAAAAAAPGVLRVAVVLLAFVMLFMGGRIIAPALAGQLYRQGDDLKARVQPRIESGLVAAMLVAAAALAVGAPWDRAAALLLLASAALGLARMARWRPWDARARPDLRCLVAGYGWLVLGVGALGAALLAGAHATAAIHLVTVGALGTLTINVMALTWLRLARRDTARARLPLWATGCIAVATAARVAADFPFEGRAALLAVASVAWSAAYALLLALFARTPALSPRREGTAAGR